MVVLQHIPWCHKVNMVNEHGNYHGSMEHVNITNSHMEHGCYNIANIMFHITMFNIER